MRREYASGELLPLKNTIFLPCIGADRRLPPVGGVRPYFRRGDPALWYRGRSRRRVDGQHQRRPGRLVEIEIQDQVA
jgi:hypothetical protein